MEEAKVSGHWTLWVTAMVADALDQALDVSSGQPVEVCGILPIEHANAVSSLFA